ncbi:MAG TPA: DUF2599 domain-containing protein [Stenotrophomonas sp.]|jgi:hypothetical protein
MSVLKYSIATLIAAAGLVPFAPARADVGSDTADLLNLMYQDTRQDCGSPSLPAFLCSGVLLRGTTPSTAYQFYSISPKNKARGGVSVSYLRTDAKFKTLAYGYKSGFIFDATQDNPEDHQDYKVLCSFAIDAATDNRDQNGCGDSARTPNDVEKFCDQMGITTAEQWLELYRSKSPSHSAQCGFDVREGSAGAADSFYQSIRAMGLISDESFNEDNELIMAPWEIDPPNSPSILASFFVNASGREGARLNQIQWYQAAKQFLPAIEMQLPQTMADEATFVYKAVDQAIFPMTQTNQCDSYIASATWTEYPGAKFGGKRIKSLKVVPTECGRRIPSGQTNNLFNELVSKYYLDPAWVNNQDNHAESISSMRRQLVCQIVINRNQPKWSLEPIRTNVTHQESIASGDCDYK